MNAWARGLAPFYGFTLRASTSDAYGWKRFWAADYGTASARPYLSVTYDLIPPGVDAISPAPNGTVDTLTPTLWALASNSANTPTVWYKFKVCQGTPAAPVNCHESGWDTSATFAMPSGWLGGWSKEHWWQVNVDNGGNQSGWLGPWWFTPVVAQPGVSAHLATAPEGGEVPGVNPQVGNYSNAVTDANVAVVGPALSVTRTYNSQDPRTNGAFGPGWSTPWDQKVEPDGDGSGSVIVTLASGQQVRFGQNPDGTYTPPPGRNLDLVFTASPPTWTLRDPSGYLRVFDGITGRLTTVTDADGRTQTYGYTTGSPVWPNLALNKSATGSTSCSSSEGPEKAVNGAVSDWTSDKWCSTAASKSWQVDLGGAMAITTVKLSHASAGPEPASLNTRDFNLQVSVDGTTWTSVATVAGNTDAVTTHTFAPTAARYVRLNITTPTQNGDPAARIYEVEVYADANLALNKPATGSTACSPSEGPEKAVNGTVNGGTSDKWCSTAASKWWQVDLGRQRRS